MSVWYAIFRAQNSRIAPILTGIIRDQLCSIPREVARRKLHKRLAARGARYLLLPMPWGLGQVQVDRTIKSNLRMSDVNADVKPEKRTLLE